MIGAQRGTRSTIGSVDALDELERHVDQPRVRTYGIIASTQIDSSITLVLQL